MAATATFSEAELAIIEAVRPAESFRETAWAEYGAEWIYHVPTAINAAVSWWFDGKSLYPYQLAAYYCPTKEATLLGGRGAGKTLGIALALAIYTALHPGESHLHVAPVKDQAMWAYRLILENGHGRGHAGFVERFIWREISAPFPEINLRPIIPGTQGNTIYFRSLGDVDIERLRSITVQGGITCEEAFRTVHSPDTYNQLRGCLRGFNPVLMGLLPAPERDWLEHQIREIASLPQGSERQVLQTALDVFAKQKGINPRGFFLEMGNSGPDQWIWDRAARGRTDPEHYWTHVATTYDNPAIGREAQEAMERAFEDNPEMLDVEMLARQPRGMGNTFPNRLITGCTDRQALITAQANEKAGLPEWVVAQHSAFGIYLYQEPPLPGHWYVIAADPGSGLAPGRNKFCIGVWDVTENPCRLVYFEIGYLHHRQVGDYKGFFAQLHYVKSLYPCGPGDMWVESTGPQKGMGQISWPEDLSIVAVDLNTKKPMYISFARQLMGHQVVRWPNIGQLVLELSNYDEPDIDLVQDCVMMLICAAGALWRKYGRSWEKQESGPRTEGVPVEPTRRRATRQRSNRGRRR